MSEEHSELVAVRLENGWFLSLRKGDPTHGLLISEEAARLINAAGSLLLAARTALSVISGCTREQQPDEKIQMLAESTVVQLETAIHLATSNEPYEGQEPPPTTK